MKTSLNTSEIKEMIRTAPTLRDEMILSFYWDTGARESELLGVQVKNIDFENRQLLIPHLKVGIMKKCPSCGRRAGKSTAFCSKCGLDLRKVDPTGQKETSRLIGFGSENFRPDAKIHRRDEAEAR